MTDYFGSHMELMLKRIETLFCCDRRGRLVSVNQWSGGAAPVVPHVMV